MWYVQSAFPSEKFYGILLISIDNDIELFLNNWTKDGGNRPANELAP
jgi:hypothetical protein